MTEPMMQFAPQASVQAGPQPSQPLDDLRIECVTFDAAGVPKRRRLVSFLAMLQPLASRPEQTRRRALAQGRPHI